MIQLAPRMRIFVATTPVDFRGDIDFLAYPARCTNPAPSSSPPGETVHQFRGSSVLNGAVCTLVSRTPALGADERPSDAGGHTGNRQHLDSPALTGLAARALARVPSPLLFPGAWACPPGTLLD